MAISFVAAGSTWTRNSLATGYTLNIPTVAAGDLLIAMVAFYPGSGASLRSITPPSGWTTKVNFISIDSISPANGDRCQIAVLYKTATGSEPATYTDGVIGASVQLIMTDVAAYRGVQSIGNAGSAEYDEVSSGATATVNNPTATGWRVVAAAYVSGTANYDISVNEVSMRGRAGIDDEGGIDRGVMGGLWDSNAAIAVGNHNRTVSKSNTWAAAGSYIMILNASTGTPATGELSWTLTKPTVSAAGEIHDDATMAIQLGNATIAADGFGQPPVVTGTATVQLGGISQSFEANVPVTGEMSAMLLPTIDFVGETRVFGVRVIEVEADDRTILVQSRGVDD